MERFRRASELIAQVTRPTHAKGVRDYLLKLGGRRDRQTVVPNENCKADIHSPKYRIAGPESPFIGTKADETQFMYQRQHADDARQCCDQDGEDSFCLAGRAHLQTDNQWDCADNKVQESSPRSAESIPRFHQSKRSAALQRAQSHQIIPVICPPGHRVAGAVPLIMQ